MPIGAGELTDKGRARMILRPIHITLFFLGLSACGGENPVANLNDPVPVVTVLPSNEDIIAAIYDSNYTVPDGFFVDERADTPQSYSLYHVKDPSISYELCTDDYTQALQWEEADNIDRPVNGYYVGSYENDTYFEFIRELSYPNDAGNVQGITSPGFARVFKCDNVNRDGVDRNLRNGYAGVLNMRPLSLSAIRELTEYLWQFVFFETSQSKVLQSYSTERQAAFEHTLLLGFALNQGTGLCDRIEVVDWTFSADKSSGQVTKKFLFLFSIEAQVVDGTPEQC
jgi:hypothetical protein